MSVVTARGSKTLLPRKNPDEFWGTLRSEYAAEDCRRWKNLAMLSLTEALGWPPERVALAFGVTRRQVNRGVDATRRTLRTRFRPEWERGPREEADGPPGEERGEA